MQMILVRHRCFFLLAFLQNILKTMLAMEEKFHDMEVCLPSNSACLYTLCVCIDTSIVCVCVY